jgi:hypothetical protein
MDALVWALSAIFYPTEEHEFVVVYDSPVSISPTETDRRSASNSGTLG